MNWFNINRNISIKVISRFIQLQLPLPLSKPMVQSRCGMIQILEAQTHPLTKVISRFIQLHIPLLPLKFSPPESGPPHALIEPSALRAAKALLVE
jgi:hypothetical protein